MMGTSPDPSHPPNFIIFGEMGVGKSSLINLIAGKDVTKTSSGAQSCTLDSTEHTINLADYQLNVHLYDTVSKHDVFTTYLVC
jgi:putative ribosome biogenesis GTPase RsgA